MSKKDYVIDQFLPPHCRTMQSIADELGISRQRVHQILSDNNVKGNDGGRTQQVHLAHQAKQKQQAQKKARHIFEKYGCDEKTVLSLNGGKKISEDGTPAKKYRSYISNLRKGGIPCNLSFPDWYHIWQKSGKYSKMGRGKDGYGMTRIDHSQPVSKDNVTVERCDLIIKRLRGTGK